MQRELILETRGDAIHCALLEDGRLAEYFRDRIAGQPGVGSMYLGRVERILPGMDAAFVHIGEEKNAFLPLGKDAPPLREGDAVVCQVEKDPGGEKGKKLSWKVSLPGLRIALLAREPGVRACSARIKDPAEGERLLDIVRRCCPPQYGVILRTAAKGCTEAELSAEIHEISETWERMLEQSAFQRPPQILWTPGALHFLREALGMGIDQVALGEASLREAVQAMLESLPPDRRPPMEWLPEAPGPFAKYGIGRQLEKARRRKVWLDSGGFLLFDHPEAFWVIDVNTGKHTGKTDLQQTALRTNLEALPEIARQMRLRDLGGIVVADLVDVPKARRSQLLGAMREAVRADRAKPQVLEISGLCLLQMTRKTQRESLESIFWTDCPRCGGQGRLPREEDETT